MSISSSIILVCILVAVTLIILIYVFGCCCSLLFFLCGNTTITMMHGNYYKAVHYNIIVLCIFVFWSWFWYRLYSSMPWIVVDPTTAATPLPLPPPPKCLLLLKRIFATIIPGLCVVLPWRNMRIASSNVFMVASRSFFSFSNVLICLTFFWKSSSNYFGRYPICSNCSSRSSKFVTNWSIVIRICSNHYCLVVADPSLLIFIFCDVLLFLFRNNIVQVFVLMLQIHHIIVAVPFDIFLRVHYPVVSILISNTLFQSLFCRDLWFFSWLCVIVIIIIILIVYHLNSLLIYNTEEASFN